MGCSKECYDVVMGFYRAWYRGAIMSAIGCVTKVLKRGALEVLYGCCRECYAGVIKRVASMSLRYYVDC